MTGWVTTYPDGTLDDFSSAEDARKAAKLYNKAHGQSLARVFRNHPVRGMEEIQL